MDERNQSMFKSKIRGPLQEVILPDFPDDDNTATTTVTKSRRVSFGTNFVKEFIVGSAASAQFVSEYEQAFPPSDSSNSSHSAVDSGILDPFASQENLKVHSSVPPVVRSAPDTLENCAKRTKFSRTICFNADSPTADMEFTEGCITLAKNILDKKNKDMTVIIQAKPKESKKEDKPEKLNKEDQTQFFEGSAVDMSITKCFKSKETKKDEKSFIDEKTKIFCRFEDEMSITRCDKVIRLQDSKISSDDESDLSLQDNCIKNQIPLDVIMRHLDKDTSDLDKSLFYPEKPLSAVLNSSPFDVSNDSEKLNLNESMDISKDFNTNVLKKIGESPLKVQSSESKKLSILEDYNEFAPQIFSSQKSQDTEFSSSQKDESFSGKNSAEKEDSFLNIIGAGGNSEEKENLDNDMEMTQVRDVEISLDMTIPKVLEKSKETDVLKDEEKLTNSEVMPSEKEELNSQINKILATWSQPQDEDMEERFEKETEFEKDPELDLNTLCQMEIEDVEVQPDEEKIPRLLTESLENNIKTPERKNEASMVLDQEVLEKEQAEMEILETVEKEVLEGKENDVSDETESFLVRVETMESDEGKIRRRSIKSLECAEKIKTPEKKNEEKSMILEQEVLEKEKAETEILEKVEKEILEEKENNDSDEMEPFLVCVERIESDKEEIRRRSIKTKEFIEKKLKTPEKKNEASMVLDQEVLEKEQAEMEILETVEKEVLEGKENDVSDETESFLVRVETMESDEGKIRRRSIKSLECVEKIKTPEKKNEEKSMILEQEMLEKENAEKEILEKVEKENLEEKENNVSDEIEPFLVCVEKIESNKEEIRSLPIKSIDCVDNKIKTPERKNEESMVLDQEVLEEKKIEKEDEILKEKELPLDEVHVMETDEEIPRLQNESMECMGEEMKTPERKNEGVSLFLEEVSREEKAEMEVFEKIETEILKEKDGKNKELMKEKDTLTEKEEKEKEALKEMEEIEKRILKEREEQEKEALKQKEEIEKRILKEREEQEKEALKQKEEQEKEALKQKEEIEKRILKEREEQEKEALKQKEEQEKEALKQKEEIERRILKEREEQEKEALKQKEEIERRILKEREEKEKVALKEREEKEKGALKDKEEKEKETLKEKEEKEKEEEPLLAEIEVMQLDEEEISRFEAEPMEGVEENLTSERQNEGEDVVLRFLVDETKEIVEKEVLEKTEDEVLEEREPPLVDIQVMNSLKNQSNEPGCIWSLSDETYTKTKKKFSWSFKFKLLESSTKITFFLKVPDEDRFDFEGSVVKGSEIYLEESERPRIEEYYQALRFGFEKQKKFFKEEPIKLESVRHIPYFLDLMNSHTSKLNAYLDQVYSVLRKYPGSTLKGSVLSFRLYSFPVFFSSTVSIDLTEMFRLSKSSLSFHTDLGSLNEKKIIGIFEESLKKDNSIIEFIVQSTKYIISLERECDCISKRHHIELLPLELRFPLKFQTIQNNI